MTRYLFSLLVGSICISSVVVAQEKPAPQPDSVQATIILIGDGGKLTNGRQPVVDAVRKTIPLNERTTIVYLGDNLYKTGLPDNSLPTYAVAKAPLDSQVNIARGTPSKVFVIPGNHDWANGGSAGYRSILRVQAYIDFLGDDNVKMYPRNGCPGPVEQKINKDVTLVMMDSQWWLHEEDKPGVESDCPTKTKEEVLTQLDDILSQNSDKLVILATHHPFRTYGPHGGFFKIKQHIFPFTDAKPNLYIPLPIIGSIYPLTRQVFGTMQDLKHPLYQDMISRISKVVVGHKNVIFVAGHEHTLQVIRDKGYNFIVSGSGSKTNRVSESKNTLYAASETGFITLDISKNKYVTANAYTVADSGVNRAFSQPIMNFTTVQKPEDTTALRVVEFTFKDTVVISASDQYKNPSGFRKTFLGSNYRKEWSEPVAMKVFNIRTEKGGLTVKSLGGGKQTKSLKLTDKNGKEWALRGLDKDPEQALPANLRGTFAQDILQDMISASHPYGSLTVSPINEALGIVAGKPELFFVPDDPALGIYQKIFANTVVTLEDRDPTPDNTDTKSTNTVLNKMYDDNDHHVQQKEVLTARLVDMLIGDFDRHADQWKWGVADTGKGKLYYPVPRDRDQAYFNSDGILAKLISVFAIPYLHGFKENFVQINKFNEVAKDFDRSFLNNLSEKDWSDQLDYFQATITDDVIKKAIKRLPPEIYKMDSAFLVRKLISRRDGIKKAGMKYYRFLSESVTVTGSNKREFFHITNDGGKPMLSVYKKNKESDTTVLMYKRTFDKRTKELIMFGLNGEDVFKVDDDVNSRIKLRIIGGKGNDTFQLAGNTRKYLYDLSTEKNALEQTRRTRNLLSNNPEVLEYNDTKFKYNRFIFPLLKVGYNVEDKFLIGFGFSSTREAFRKKPFGSNQSFGFLAAPSRKAFQANYTGVFNQVLGKNDLIINASFISPTLNNFFGFGNTSVFDKSKGLEFYRVRYRNIIADVLYRKRIAEIASFAFGPTYYHYSSEFANNKGRLIDNQLLFDSASTFSSKDYLGGKVRFDVNYLDNQLFPKRGFLWNTEFVATKNINNNGEDYTMLKTDMAIYANVTGNSTVTGVFRLGGGKIYSDNPEYFQLLTFGANNFIRGYRKNRYAGTSLAYFGSEARIKLFNSKSYLLPGEFGIMTLFDVGRVWYTGESSNKWHSAYGGGIYFAPFNLALISAVIGISPEDKLFNFTLGSKFNLTF